MTIIHPLLASRSAPNYRQSWRLAGVWRRAINLMTESGELLTLHRQGVVSAPADGCFAARNSMRYAVDYAAMNDHRLWHKGFVSGVSRLNSHSVIVCYVLRRLRILNRLPLHGCNARRKPGFSGHWHWRQAIRCLLNYASFVTVFRPRSMALRPTGGTGWVKAPD